MNNRIRLSSKGMERVCQHNPGKFKFFVGDKEHECGVLEACFLSSRVNRLLLSDCTAESIRLERVDVFEDAFEDFLALGSGESIVID